MSVEFDIDTSELDTALIRLAQESEKGFGEVVREEAKLLTKQLYRNTAPKTAKVGRDAVKADISRAVDVITRESWSNITSEGLRSALEDATDNQDEVALQGLLSRMNNRQGQKHVVFTPAVHKAQRGSRGRIQSNKGRKANWTFRDGAYKETLKRALASVGYAKSGWVPSGLALGLSFPAWVMKFARKPGRYQDESRQKTNPGWGITHTNVTYMPSMRSWVMGATSLRAKSLAKKTERMIREAIKKAGFK